MINEEQGAVWHTQRAIDAVVRLLQSRYSAASVYACMLILLSLRCLIDLCLVSRSEALANPDLASTLALSDLQSALARVREMKGGEKNPPPPPSQGGEAEQ
jgi:hypothetical protein